MKPTKCPYHYTKLADGFLEAFRCFDFGKHEMRALLWTVENTYKTGEEWAEVSGSILAPEIGTSDRRLANRVIRSLVSERVLLEKKNGPIRLVRLSKNINHWKTSLLSEKRPHLTLIKDEKGGAYSTPPPSIGGAYSTPDRGLYYPTSGAYSTPPGAYSTPPQTGEESRETGVSPAPKNADETPLEKVEEKKKVVESPPTGITSLKQAVEVGKTLERNQLFETVLNILHAFGLPTGDDKKKTQAWVDSRTEPTALIVPAVFVSVKKTREFLSEQRAAGQERHKRPMLKCLDFAVESLEEALDRLHGQAKPRDRDVKDLRENF